LKIIIIQPASVKRVGWFRFVWVGQCR
jgi:hypothetical protein